MGKYPPDSPLDITASVAGILTFVAAIAAAGYVRWTYLRNADKEYFEVKASLSWYKTESIWLHDVVNAADGPKGRSGSEMEYQMYVFVMEQITKLEERLLELLTETEAKASKESGTNWALVPRNFRFSTNIALCWLPVRAKALELVKQRDALGSRVLFAQMSMLSSRIRDHELQSKKREQQHRERLDRLEGIVLSHNEKLDRLEDIVYRLMDRFRFMANGGTTPSECPNHKEDHWDPDGTSRQVNVTGVVSKHAQPSGSSQSEAKSMDMTEKISPPTLKEPPIGAQ